MSVEATAIPRHPAGTKPLKSARHFAQAEVLRVREGDCVRVRKSFSGSPWVVRQTLGRWLVAREARNLRRLEGLHGVPRLLGRPEPWTLEMSHLDALPVRRSKDRDKIDPAWFDSLEEEVAQIHARGTNHGDLRFANVMRHRETGEPCLIDFAQSLDLSNPRTFIGRRVRRIAFGIDHARLVKMRAAMLGVEELTPRQRRAFERPILAQRIGEFLRGRIYSPIKRRLRSYNSKLSSETQ